MLASAAGMHALTGGGSMLEPAASPSPLERLVQSYNEVRRAALRAPCPLLQA
jgi:hypothetical protein